MATDLTPEMFGDRPPEGLADVTGFLLAFNGRRAARAYAEALQPLGLRPPQILVLTLIEDSPGITQKECVGRSRIDPSSLVALVDELEELGLAQRRTHPDDRRKHAVYLTAKGRRKLQRAREVGTEVTDKLLASLEPDEREMLRHLLQKCSAGTSPP